MSGFRSKRLIAFHGRGLGKSTWHHLVQELMQPDITLKDSATVDGQTWYTVKLSMPAADWLRQQPKQEWSETADKFFDISDQLYTALMLKWK